MISGDFYPGHCLDMSGATTAVSAYPVALKSAYKALGTGWKRGFFANSVGRRATIGDRDGELVLPFELSEETTARIIHRYLSFGSVCLHVSRLLVRHAVGQEVIRPLVKV